MASPRGRPSRAGARLLATTRRRSVSTIPPAAIPMPSGARCARATIELDHRRDDWQYLFPSSDLRRNRATFVHRDFARQSDEPCAHDAGHEQNGANGLSFGREPERARRFASALAGGSRLPFGQDPTINQRLNDARDGGAIDAGLAREFGAAGRSEVEERFKHPDWNFADNQGRRQQTRRPGLAPDRRRRVWGSGCARGGVIGPTAQVNPLSATRIRFKLSRGRDARSLFSVSASRCNFRVA